MEDESGLAYLRPETAQGIFINYANVQQSARKKPPFGIGQIGKSFRNEITPGNFIFRTREFEQMEMEFFVKPGEDEEWHQNWIDERFAWYVDLGIAPEKLRLFEHPKEKLSHYSKRTVDIEYEFDFTGSQWGELEGIANRTDYDLTVHSKASGTALDFFDQESRRALDAVRHRAGSRRRPLRADLPARRLHRGRGAQRQGRRRQARRAQARPAPRAAQGRGAAAVAQRRPVAGRARPRRALRQHWNVDFDDAGAIGRRYRRQDEVGTPFCVTVDFDTLEDQAVTIRERDAMTQERVVARPGPALPARQARPLPRRSVRRAHPRRRPPAGRPQADRAARRAHRLADVPPAGRRAGDAAGLRGDARRPRRAASRCTTPVATATGCRLAEPVPLVVPVLRAGLGMLDGMTRLLPTAEVGFLGMVRDETSPGRDRLRQPAARRPHRPRGVRARPDARDRRHPRRDLRAARRPRRRPHHRHLPARRARGHGPRRRGVPDDAAAR